MPSKSVKEELEEAYNIINKSPAVVFLWKNAEGWPVEYVSENVKEVFGYTAKEFMTGKVPYASVVHPDDLERVGGEVSAYSKERGRNEFSQEYRIINKDGKTKWTDDRTWIRRNKKGEITHYQGIVLDSTKRKRAEEKLKESEEKFRTLVETAPLTIVTLDMTGKILSANKAIERDTGYKQSELIGKRINKIVTPESLPLAIREITRIFGGGAPMQIELKIKTKSGMYKWAEARPQLMQTGESKYISVVAIDITERKKALDKLKKLERGGL